MATKKVVAKFRVQSVTLYEKTKWDEATQRSVPNGYQRQLVCFAMMDQANKAWADASPGGEFKITIDNDTAGQFFRPGQCLYLEITEAPEKDTPESLARVGLK